MAEHIAKRSRLSVDEVLVELDEEESEPMTVGSDDEFEDITCTEKERDDECDDNQSHDQLHHPHSPPPSPPISSLTSSSPTAFATLLPPTPLATPFATPSPLTPSTSPMTPSVAGLTPPRGSVSWSTTLTPIDIAPFTQRVGPTVPIPTSPLEVFRLFFTDDLCSLIVQQSNLYAEQVLGEERYGNWERITVRELHAYFGFMILMGLYPKPALGDYWRRDPLIGYTPISERISRDRFYEIGRYLHFADNTNLPSRGQPGYDRLGKVRVVMEKVLDHFISLYQPNCENSIDEGMIPFQGRSSLKQYMPAKPVKRGIKVWCRADAHNGYLCEFQVYTGRSEGVQGGLGKRVVYELSQRLQGFKYHIYIDNFFTSVPLLTTLLEKGLYACGTTRHTYKGFPATLKMKGKSKREMQRHGLNSRYIYTYEQNTLTLPHFSTNRISFFTFQGRLSHCSAGWYASYSVA